MREQGNRLATEIFLRTLSAWNSVYTFRQMVQAGLPHAMEAIKWQHERMIHEFTNDPEYEKLFKVDRKALVESGLFVGVAKTLTEQSVTTFEAVVDAASLIFSHSLLDDAALDWVRVCALVGPQHFLPFLSNQRVSLSDAQQSTPAELLQKAIDTFLQNLERESLITKMDLLFSLCRPPAGFIGVTNYQYDKDRLLALDRLRHDYIHGGGPTTRLPRGEDDILFMQHTSTFLLPLVNQRYGVRIDSEMVAAHAHVAG